jgi:hypothetical protein
MQASGTETASGISRQTRRIFLLLVRSDSGKDGQLTQGLDITPKLDPSKTRRRHGKNAKARSTPRLD